MAYNVDCGVVNHSCENWRELFFFIFKLPSCSENSIVHGCKLTPAHLGFSSKLVRRVIMCAEADSENFRPVPATVF